MENEGEKDINNEKNNNQNNEIAKSVKRPLKENAPYIMSLNPSSSFDMCFKVVIIGNCGVGKTCITNRAVKSQFEGNYKSTIGLEYFSMFVKINNKIIKLQVWDTCGQEMYRSLISNYYRNSSLAIIVYSITDLNSFKDIDIWIKELKSMSSPDIKLMLIGNKVDLIEERKVTYNEGKNLVDQYGFHFFSETSAKTGENIEKLFIKAARLVYEDYLIYEDEYSDKSSAFSKGQSQNTSLKINMTKKHQTHNKCC